MAELNKTICNKSHDSRDLDTNQSHDSPQKFIFLIPYFNHPRKIRKLVCALTRYKIDILIIDDGSNLEAKNALKNLNAKILTRQTKTAARARR